MSLNLKLLTCDKQAIGFLFIFYIAFGLLLFFFQEQIVYQPSQQDFESCPAFSEAEKITHQGTRMYYKDNGERLAVLYHGNGGSACDRAFLAEMFESAGYSYIVVEYAGYSNDTKQPSHKLVKQDVEHVIEFVGKLQYSQLVIVGESIGSGAASYHISLSHPDKLLLISSFSSLKDAARKKFWIYPASILTKNAFDNIALLSSFSGEVLIIHGEKDNIISIEIARKLFNGLNTEHKKFVSVPQVGHNDIFSDPLVFDEIYDFLKR